MNTFQHDAKPAVELPGLDCGVCGFRKCEELAERLVREPQLLKRCIHLSGHQPPMSTPETAMMPSPCRNSVPACSGCSTVSAPSASTLWRDSLGRELDFYLEHFPEDPGPREIILPHNPMLTREMDIVIGDVLIGRPLGMSCGCPVTHCGVVTAVDPRTGVITWCITGPLDPRRKGFKDIGYYTAEAYEGLVTLTNSDLRIGMRYFFQPRMCMLQWRHSGLLNYLNRLEDGYQVRLEGLYIG